MKNDSGNMIIANNHFNVSDIILDMKEMFEARNSVDHRNLEIRTVIPDDQFTMFSDDVRITQILSNLTDNAYKFTKKGFIELGFKIEEQSVRFYVKDTGEGINEDKKSVLSERFNRPVSDSDHITEDIGLGLFITESLVDLLGGKIGLESEQNKGSMFWFTIPTSSKDQLACNQEKSDLFQKLTGKNVLLVDPWENSSRIINKILIQHKISCTLIPFNEIFTNNFNKRLTYDLIILDINQIGAFDFLEQMKKRDSRIKILATAKEPKFSDKQEAILKGADEFIPKPLVNENLMLKICKLLI